MARINDLLRQLERTDAGLAAEIQREYDAVADRRAFGLNFERHTPEAVELPGRPVRRGDKVHVLPPRGETPKKENQEMWMVESIDKSSDSPVATIVRESGNEELESQDVLVEDLVVVAEFRDPIYPGLVSTGKVERGGDKPYHSVINGENFHALEALLFTHRGMVDAIYIDPPYNTGARDWKYNNDYVESDDMYRHSKWLAFMERRLKLAKELLNPEDSVLIVTIDEKEYLRLGLLLEQTFFEARIQMVSSVINPMGSGRANDFSRVEEFIFFVFLGSAGVPKSADNMLIASTGSKLDTEVRWTPLNRDGSSWERRHHPETFYPIFIREADLAIVHVGEPQGRAGDVSHITAPIGQTVAWPKKGQAEARWQIGVERLRQAIADGFVYVSSIDAERQTATIRYLTSGAISKVDAGEYVVTGHRSDGSKIVAYAMDPTVQPRSIWNKTSHSARDYGSALINSFLPNRKFPFPKSIYAVEDALRFFVIGKPYATIIDFFAGSGTTAHAALRLNKQDGGHRVCISVTNNEVSADEQKDLRQQNLRPGDPEWEKWGICDYITKPRIAAAITGTTPDGEPIKGDYKFTDEFPMADGFEENIEFFTLTYESSLQVSAGRAFERISPLLWLRAGSRGKRIESVPDGWAVAETYGVLVDMAKTDAFVEAIVENSSITHAFLMTDEDRLFETVTQQLPVHVEAVRMYEAYLRNFERDALRITR